MSSFITISIDHVENTEIVNRIQETVTLLNIGVFFQERYIEQFEKDIIEVNPHALFFDIADTIEFDNCENLVSGYWSDIDDFHRRMKKLETILTVCLEFADSIDFWMGTSGDQEDDFVFREIKIDDFFSTIHKSYEEDMERYHFSPPSVHFCIRR